MNTENPRNEQNYAANVNPDANPLYDREYTSDFMEALEEHITRKVDPIDTHAVFISHPSGIPRVVAMNSYEYYSLQRDHAAYLIGTEELCERTAQDVYRVNEE